MTEAWIIDACRTPRGIGKPGRGALTEIHPQRLGATVLKALAERNDVNTADVADIIWGCNVQRGQNGNVVTVVKQSLDRVAPPRRRPHQYVVHGKGLCPCKAEWPMQGGRPERSTRLAARRRSQADLPDLQRAFG